MRLRWSVADPASIGRLLSDVGLEVEDSTEGSRASFSNAVITVSRGPEGERAGWGRIVADDAGPEDRGPATPDGAGSPSPDAAGGVTPTAGGATLLGVGWATVDTERFLSALRRSEGWGDIAATSADELLGARATVVRRAGAEVAVALLEPTTEGRLAASLAFGGEGPVALYIRARPPATLRLSSRGLGPFGSQRLVVGGPASGPHLLVVDPGPAATMKA